MSGASNDLQYQIRLSGLKLPKLFVVRFALKNGKSVTENSNLNKLKDTKSNMP